MMPIFDWDLQQGTAAWFQARAGIPTASEFDQIITPKKAQMAEARHKYACRLIAERLLNWQAESLDMVKHIEEGKINEPMAVAQLEFIQEMKTERVGFVRTNDLRFGASPDRVSGVSADRASINTTIEIKCPTIPKQFEYLLLDDGDAYRCQRQGQLYIAEADKAIFYTYHPRMPACLVETGRDEEFIAKLRDALEKFSDELEEMTERAKALGLYQAFAEIVTPVEAETGEQPTDHTSPIPEGADPLAEHDNQLWMFNLDALLRAAQGTGEVNRITSHPRVVAVRRDAPRAIRSEVETMILAAFARQGEGSE